jgi:hypothetical protein
MPKIAFLTFTGPAHTKTAEITADKISKASITGLFTKYKNIFPIISKSRKNSTAVNTAGNDTASTAAAVLDNLNGKIVSVTKQITKLFNTGVDHFKCNYKRTQNGEQRPFCGRKIVKATENKNIKCCNKVKSHMTFAFYGKAETYECTFKTFDLLFHTP